ncbi:MAG: HPr kinase/phosphorylase, partial [Hyphomicrobiaceae bacterium]
MPQPSRTLIHATAVETQGRAALLLGPSGAGKSDLALRTIMSPFRDGDRTVLVSLVADDQVMIEKVGSTLLASPPPAIAGLIEVRGIGILPMTYSASAEIRLVIRLQPADTIERHPDPRQRHTILGVELP